MENEIWKDIDGWEGLYQVSSFGRCRSLTRRATNGKIYQGKILAESYTNHGYKKYSLTIGPKSKTYPAHILVAKAFIDNPERKPQVNHKNGIKHDCLYLNLEWNTVSENNQHAYDTGLKKPQRGKDSINSKRLICCDLNDNKLAIFNSLREAARVLGVARRAIMMVIDGSRKQMYGLTFKHL